MFVDTPIHRLDDGTVVFGLRQPVVLPATGDQTLRVTADAENRLDLISARTLGDPAAWWAIADCSGLIDPLAGVTTGLNLRVPAAARLPA